MDDEFNFTDLEVQPIIVSKKDFDFIMEMCENPPEPNERLIKALKKHKEVFEDKKEK